MKREKDFIGNLMEAHGTPMVQLTYRRTGSPETAEDLVQETFLLAYYKREIVCAHENPVAWLYDVLNKLTMREMAKAYHHCELALLDNDFFGSFDVELPMEYYLPRNLKEEDRKIILLRLDKGYSFADIAEITGVKEATCRKQFSRALERCKKLMLNPTETKKA